MVIGAALQVLAGRRYMEYGVHLLGAYQVTNNILRDVLCSGIYRMVDR